MSPCCSLLAAVSVLPTLLASLTQQTMLVAGAVGTGVVAWFLWNALHSDPVPKYDPWANDRDWDATAQPNTSSESFGDGVAAPISDSRFPAQPEATARDPRANRGDPLQSLRHESGAAAPTNPAEGAEDVRAMLNQIEDPEVRRMLSDSLKQIEDGASA